MKFKFKSSNMIKTAGKSEKSSFSSDPENWMTNLPTRIRDRIPIINLAIPGSHDSCSYGINKSSKIAPDSEDVVKAIFPFVPCVIRRWAKTQNYSLLQQLQNGVRYFDLRTAFNQSDNLLYFVHGVYCIEISDPIDEIFQFLNSHPKEVVILDFQHFYDFTWEHHRDLCDFVVKKFESMIYERFLNEENFPNFTLTQAFHFRRQLIVVYRNYKFIDKRFFTTNHWPNPWPNVTSTEELMKCLEENLQNRQSYQGFCSQVLLTPTTKFILPRFYSTLKAKCAKKVDKKCKEWLMSQTPGIFKENEKKLSNVFLFDFVDLQDGSVTKIIIDLNMKLMEM